MDQGISHSSNLQGHRWVPAVCIGSNAGGETFRLQVVEIASAEVWRPRSCSVVIVLLWFHCCTARSLSTFNRLEKSARIEVSGTLDMIHLEGTDELRAEDGSSCSTSGKWATCTLNHSGIESGKARFSVRILNHVTPAGCAVGLVDAKKFLAKK